MVEEIGLELLLLISGYVYIDEYHVYYKRKIYTYDILKVDDDTNILVFTLTDNVLEKKMDLENIRQRKFNKLISVKNIAIDRYKLTSTNVKKLPSEMMTSDDIDLLKYLVDGYMWNNEDKTLFILRDVYIEAHIAVADVLTTSNGKWVKSFRERGGFNLSKRLPSWLMR